MKNLIFREGHQKPIYRGQLPKKEEAWQKEKGGEGGGGWY